MTLFLVALPEVAREGGPVHQEYSFGGAATWLGEAKVP
tara:strand:+ start:313 stop:426 length:114 start_codon:yes stop_codon:yes gene_type:complete